jgi:hypothetical protein
VEASQEDKKKKGKEREKERQEDKMRRRKRYLGQVKKPQGHRKWRRNQAGKWKRYWKSWRK